jgi:drug/metabolite transporter (DMT)-like permease
VAGSRRDWLGGIFWSVTSAVTQAIGFVIARYALQEVELITGTMLRLIPAVILLLPLTARRDVGWSLLLASPWQLGRLTLAAVCGGGVGLFLLATGTKYAPVGVITTIGATLPIWVIPVSWLALGERARPAQLAWTLLAIVGIALLFVGDV